MGKDKVHTVYKLKDGTRVIGVTTALGILAKPALIHWSWNLGCQGIDYRKFRDDKADIGTLVHHLVLCYLKGDKPDTSDYTKNQIDQAENCMLSFYEWRKGKLLTPYIVEEPMVSERWGFGGMPDFYGLVDEVPTLLDFKTGKGIYPEMSYQLAAYRELLMEQREYVENCAILNIGRAEDEAFQYQNYPDLEHEWEIFKACLNIYNLQKAIKKRG